MEDWSFEWISGYNLDWLKIHPIDWLHKIYESATKPTNDFRSNPKHDELQIMKCLQLWCKVCCFCGNWIDHLLWYNFTIIDSIVKKWLLKFKKNMCILDHWIIPNHSIVLWYENIQYLPSNLSGCYLKVSSTLF